MNIPILCKPKVYHVGTLNPAHKREGSLEGNLLSVSECPNAWTMIAQLGGLPLHKLRKKKAQFLDFHEVDKSNLFYWGRRGNLVEYVSCWRVEEEDEEGATRFFYTQDESETEYAEARKIDEHPVATEEAIKKTGMTCRLSNLNDVLAYLLAEDAGLDGVWWADDYDPLNLSAPRGGIFPNLLRTWKAERVQGRDEDDDHPDEDG